MEYGQSNRIRSNSELKKSAKESLKGNFGIAILACLITSLITGRISWVFNVQDVKMHGIDRITSNAYVNFTNIISFVLNGPMNFGLACFFLKLIRDKSHDIQDIFIGFKSFGKNFLTNLVIEIYTFLWSLLVVIPSIILLIAFSLSLDDIISLNIEEVSNGVMVLFIIITIVSSIILFYITLRYSMVFYILNDNKDIKIMDAINKSVQITKNYRKKLFLLYLSFTGLAIVCILTVGIGFIWLNPYVKTTVANFYEDIREKEVMYTQC